MPAPSITTFLPVPEPAGSCGGPAHAAGRLINPSAVIVSYRATEPPATPTRSRKRLRVKAFFCFVIKILQGVESEIALGKRRLRSFADYHELMNVWLTFCCHSRTSRGNDCNAITMEARWFGLASIRQTCLE